MAAIELNEVVKTFTGSRRAGRLRRQHEVVRAVDEITLAIDGTSRPAWSNHASVT